MKEIKVTFKTITPLWTGDAWGDCKEIKPSAIMGSLRFWFETIMYFRGILENEDFNSKSGRFEKEVDRKKLKDFVQKHGNDKVEIIKYLINKQHIPISSVIFGATNWRSLIEIKKIEFDENRFQDEPKGKIIPNKKWYFGSPSYQGEFEIIFKVKEEILNSIFYPLLTFMDKYGFWGGKWNIGYGRLKIESIEENNIVKNSWQKSDFELFGDICFSWENLINQMQLDNNASEYEILKMVLKVENFYCNTERKFEQKISNIPKKIVLINNLLSDNNFEDLIKGLLVKKARIRNCLRYECEEIFQKECFKDKKFQKDKKIKCNQKEIECKECKKEIMKWKNFRHKILGERGEGSKVLPFIFEENNQLKSGFLSVAGLLNLEGESNA